MILQKFQKNYTKLECHLTRNNIQSFLNTQQNIMSIHNYHCFLKGGKPSFSLYKEIACLFISTTVITIATGSKSIITPVTYEFAPED